MKLDDPEYASVYYKAMVMDQSGLAGKCVKPPTLGGNVVPRSITPFRPTATRPLEGGPMNPATYPDNIPLGGQGSGRGEDSCYGCFGTGHRVNECPRIAVLVANNVIMTSPETRRFVMKNGAEIRRYRQESLAQAAERMAGDGAPRVMLGLADPLSDRQAAVQSFYQDEIEHQWRMGLENIADTSDETSADSEDSSQEEIVSPEVFLSPPMQVSRSPYQVHPVERTEPSTRRARKVVFDGVYPPRREKTPAKVGEVRDLRPDLESSKKGTTEREVKTQPGSLSTDAPLPGKTLPDKVGKVPVRPPTPVPGVLKPDVHPIEIRKPRGGKDEDTEMQEAETDEKGKKNSRKTTGISREAKEEEDEIVKLPGRQSELSKTVDQRSILSRVLDTPVTMTFREILASSKDIRTHLQDLIKVKNVRAVLLGNSRDHPLIANFGWPRSDGILIKIDMKTGGRTVCAIIDTGSQLNVVRADVAHRKIRQPIDMSQVANMNDANGGQGQLQGWIQDTAPFSLLLGRPWQRGNLVSIDERDEGTYLIFKDRETRMPRYELLAVPHGGPDANADANQYQTFAFLRDLKRPEGHDKNSFSGTEIGHPYGTTPSASKRLKTQRRMEGNERQSGLCRDNGERRVFSLEERIWKNLLEATYKSRQRGQMSLAEFCVSPSFSSTMALSRLISDPLLLRDNSQGPFGPHEAIQYLRRQQTGVPPMPVVSLNTTGPIAAIEDLVAHRWTDWEQRRPLQIRPTFSVSPNAEYFGKRELANGQVVHRSLATNVLRVFPADGSGLPYTLACHEFTVHLAAPTTPSDVWRLECPYPADARLQDAVASMVPRGIDLGFELAFPMHATSVAPDMLPLMERLQLNQTLNEDDAVVDTLYGQQDTSMGPRDTVIRPTTAAATGRRTSGYGARKYEPHAIALESESDDLFGSDDSGSMPELVSEGESVALGLCPLCLGAEHASVFNCPLYVPRLSESEVTAIHALNSLASIDVTALPEMSSDMRRALDETKGPLQTEWVAPTALRPHETAEVREMLEKFTTEYDEGQAARNATSEQTLAKELEKSFHAVPMGTVNRIRTETPIPHVPSLISPTHNRSNEPSHTALLDPPAFYRNGRVVDRELWSSSSPSDSITETSSDSYDMVNTDAPTRIEVHERIPVLTLGGWSPAVTEWSVEIPDFMFNPAWIIDEAVARALNVTVAEPPATASTASSTNATPSSNGDLESGLYAPYHRLPQFSFQPGNPEDVQLALYFWLYDGALQQLDARRFEDKFGSEPAEKALRVLHGPLSRFIDYTAMATEGVHSLQHLAPLASLHPMSPIPEQSGTSDDGLHPTHSPTSLDHSLPSHSPHSTTSSVGPNSEISSYDYPGEREPDNHSAEPFDPSDEFLEEAEISESDTRFFPGISSPAMDRKRKNPDGDADGGFQQGRCQRAFAAAARAVAAASPEDIRYFGGIRLAILAMSHFLEEVCWRLYGIDETSFPGKFPSHPLLYDLEAAKVQTIWSVLQRHGRERLANNLHELLSIRICSDIVDSHLFDPKTLDERYPEHDVRYWDLLHDPDVEPLTRAEFAACMEFDESDSSDSDDEDMQLGYPDSGRHSSDDELDMPVRQWIRAAPNYYPPGPPYAVRSGALVADRGSVLHSL
ncbi:hypothetical protein K438DRAFT_1986103 [Mycena galopus ATCC 62051]|nr:hypothetical protein K438DRAFT_1986103 [Mycena galopus ATCC 62051]